MATKPPKSPKTTVSVNVCVGIIPIVSKLPQKKQPKYSSFSIVIFLRSDKL